MNIDDNDVAAQSRIAELEAGAVTVAEGGLLPCPFCGSPAVLIESGQYFVKCTKLGVCYGGLASVKIGGEGEGFRIKDDAIKLWNARATYAPASDADFYGPDDIDWIAFDKIAAKLLTRLIELGVDVSDWDGDEDGIEILAKNIAALRAPSAPVSVELVIGASLAYACSLADRDIDIRLKEVPAMANEIKAAIAAMQGGQP